MGTSLKKRAGTGSKVGIACCAAGSLASFLWLHWWILGILFIGGGVYFFWQLLKDYAASGKRF
ncbi:MAG: hypothetical protein II767_03300 [Proteobacteria bacterium]|nr:hypothetical protein [Pseudomonadota bacterium]MBQ4359259.1 hypothetical protein [Pseudomonadota bacterium]